MAASVDRVRLGGLLLLGVAVAAWSAPAAKGPATLSRKLVDVAIPMATAVPGELVPVKPGGTEKVTPAALRAVWKVGPLPPVSAVCFSPDGKRLFAGAYGRISVWDLATGALSRGLEGPEGAIHDLVLSPDGKHLAAAGGKPAQTGTVLIYNAADPQRPTRRLGDHTDVIYSLAWSPDGKRIATASFDKTVKVWDVGTGAMLLTVKEHSAAVFAVAFSPDGKFLASGGRDDSVKLFDAATGKSIRAMVGHNDDVHAIVFSADGASLISTGVERPLRWWETSTGKSIRSQGGHGGQVFEIRRSTDGKQLLSVSADQTVRLWDGATGALQKSYSSGGDPLLSAAISPDGTRIVAGGQSGFIRFWDAASARLLASAVERPGAGSSGEVLMSTPEGYLAPSTGVAEQLRWEVGGVNVAGSPFMSGLLKPDEVLKALRGEAVSPVKLEVPK